jgi:hypothetical protein
MRSLYSLMMWGDHSSSPPPLSELGVVGVDGVESQELEVGTAIPAVLKKSSGEAKESNVDNGAVKSLSFRKCSVGASQVFSHPALGEDDEEVDGEGVEIEVQSKIASRAISPEMVVGSCFEGKLSVRAREVARVPPRKEPYIRRGRWIWFGIGVEGRL